MSSRSPFEEYDEEGQRAWIATGRTLPPGTTGIKGELCEMTNRLGVTKRKLRDMTIRVKDLEHQVAELRDLLGYSEGKDDRIDRLETTLESLQQMVLGMVTK